MKDIAQVKKPSLTQCVLTIDDLNAEVETLEKMVDRKLAEYYETRGALEAIRALCAELERKLNEQKR